MYSIETIFICMVIGLILGLILGDIIRNFTAQNEQNEKTKQVREIVQLKEDLQNSKDKNKKQATVIRRLKKDQQKLRTVPVPIPQPQNFLEMPVWQGYSHFYRESVSWKCETCGLVLWDDRRLLHVHHKKGRNYNNAKDLIALCIGCHAEQPGGRHQELKDTEEYKDFTERYGQKWCSRLKKQQKQI